MIITYWSSQKVHFEFKGTPLWPIELRPFDGLRTVDWFLIVTVRLDKGANPGGALSDLWLVNRCSFSGLVSTVGLGFGLEKKFSLLSVSFRSVVLDRKIVMFDLFWVAAVWTQVLNSGFWPRSWTQGSVDHSYAGLNLNQKTHGSLRSARTERSIIDRLCIPDFHLC